MDDKNEGLLLVNKAVGETSFNLVRKLRRRLNIKKIGHAGTLDPFATGLMVMLIGRKYTKLSDSFLNDDKEYIATAYLGIATDSYDCDGQEISKSEICPSLGEIEKLIEDSFQGEIMQTPPMFSAKKINGQKLYKLARQGIEIERLPVAIKVDIKLLEYNYPSLKFQVLCSKGTYIRSIAHDMGEKLGCGAHLTALERIRCGKFPLSEAIDSIDIENQSFDIQAKIRK